MYYVLGTLFRLATPAFFSTLNYYDETVLYVFIYLFIYLLIYLFILFIYLFNLFN